MNLKQAGLEEMKKVFASCGSIVSSLGLTGNENFNSVVLDKTGLNIFNNFSFSKNSFCASILENELLDNVFSNSGNPAAFTKLEKMSIISIAKVTEKSGIDLSNKDTLLIYSTTKGNIDLLDGSSNLKDFVEKRIYLAGMMEVISKYFKCANEPVIISNACVSGLLAILVARRMLAAGSYKNIIVAGGDIVSEFTLSGFKVLNALSDVPCKPFDAERKGINLGEAAGAVLLSTENLEGGSIEVLSGSISNDANHISGPSRKGEGLFQSIKNTIKNFPPDQIDFICAHGTATSFNDEMEAIAFSRAGLKNVPLNGLKGFFGHTLGAAGLIESIMSIEALKQNYLIATKGFEKPGVSENINVIKKTERKELNVMLKTSSGFGGCNASVLFCK